MSQFRKEVSIIVEYIIIFLQKVFGASVFKKYWPQFYISVPPTIKAVNQLVGAPVEREVTLECIVEVYPKPLNGWYRNEGNFALILQ